MFLSLHDVLCRLSQMSLSEVKDLESVMPCSDCVKCVPDQDPHQLVQESGNWIFGSVSERRKAVASGPAVQGSGRLPWQGGFTLNSNGLPSDHNMSSRFLASFPPWKRPVKQNYVCKLLLPQAVCPQKPSMGN